MTLKQQKTKCMKFSFRLWSLITVAGAIASALTILSFFGHLFWIADLFSHFRVQYFIGLTAAALLLLIPRKRKTALCFALLAAVNLSTILPFYIGQAERASGSKPTFRAMLLNVNTKLGNADRVLAVINKFDPDIVVLEEVNTRWINDLRLVTNRYGHSKILPRGDNFGIAFYSKLPLLRANIVYIGTAGVPSIVAEIDAAGEKATVIGTHPLPPVGSRYSHWRNDQLEKISDFVGSVTSPVLLLGDLNVTPWSHHFRQLLKRSGLRDASQGRGIQPTWPTQNCLLQIPIDHCLHSPEIVIVQKEIGPHVGSDHYPVIVDFIVESSEKTDIKLSVKAKARIGPFL
ncbi:MAG: endonuclease/exonuclease/phosphatase family protein [Pseudomonadota bacterium]